MKSQSAIGIDPLLVFVQMYKTNAKSLDLKDIVLFGQGFLVVKSEPSNGSHEPESMSLCTASARHCNPRSISSVEA